MKGEKFTGINPGKGDCGDGGGGREAENAVGRCDFAAGFWAGRPGRGWVYAGDWGLFAFVLVDRIWRTAAPSRRNAITPLVENMLDRPLQLILVAPILVNGSGSRPTRSIEAMLNVVEPDHCRAEDRHDPETTAQCSIGILMTLHRIDFDDLPKAALRQAHLVPPTINEIPKVAFRDRAPATHFRANVEALATQGWR